MFSNDHNHLACVCRPNNFTNLLNTWSVIDQKLIGRTFANITRFIVGLSRAISVGSMATSW